MRLLDNKPLLYALIAVLAACRFLVVPIIQWQNQTLAETNKAQQRYQKTLNLLHNRTAFSTQLQQLQTDNLAMGSQLLAPGPVLPTQLRLQREIEAKAKQLGIQVRGINWLEPIKQGQLRQLRAKIALMAKSQELVEFHLFLQNYPKASQIEDLNIRPERWRQGHSRKVSASFEFTLYQLAANHV